jgi:proline iminopeptidase
MTKHGVIESNGFNLAYQVDGKGSTLLVIGSSIYYPRIFSQQLRNHFQLVFADMRAFAPPPTSDLPLNFDLNLLLEDIECMRVQLELGPVIILGHSGNAFLALEYAKKYPSHVSHVIMVACGPDFSDASQKLADQYWETTASPNRKAALKKSLEKYPHSQYSQVPMSKRFVWDYVRHSARLWYHFDFDHSFLWEGVNVNMPIFEYVWGTLFKHINIEQGLDTFDKPVLLALGQYDFDVAPLSAWNHLIPKFKDLSILLFEQSGHTPFFEEADLFDTRLLEWLNPSQ